MILTTMESKPMTDDFDIPYSADEYLERHPEMRHVFSRAKLYAAARGHIKGTPPMAVIRVGPRLVRFTHRGVQEWLAARLVAESKPHTPLTDERLAKRRATLAANRASKSREASL